MTLNCLTQAACMTFEVDIICVTVTEKQPFHFKRAPVNGVSIQSGNLYIFSLWCDSYTALHQISLEVMCWSCVESIWCVSHVYIVIYVPEGYALVIKLFFFFFFNWVLPFCQALDRGVFFEIVYTPAIRDSTMRRYTIGNSLGLMETCKGKVCIHTYATKQNKSKSD